MANTPIRFNASAVIEDAFLDLGVFQAGETIPPFDAAFALRLLNKLITTLAIQPLTCPTTEREVFSVVAAQNTYTMGPAGDFDTVRPPSGLIGAGLLMPTSGATIGQVEIPLAPLTDDAYQAIQAKDLQSAMFTDFYFIPEYAGGLASVYLWPTPNSTTYQLVLYRADPIAGFANLTTLYDFPPGYAEMLQYQLEKRLAKPYGQPWGPVDEDKASQALFLVKRNNFTLVDLALDPAMTNDSRGGYNIITGAGG